MPNGGYNSYGTTGTTGTLGTFGTSNSLGGNCPALSLSC